MKKLLMAVAAFGMLLTSCAKDDTAQMDSVVTFTVNTPDVATRAYGEGKEATTLYWAVYDQNGIVEQLTGSKSINLTTTVDLKLIQGRTYDVLFWAANASMANVYKVDFTTKSMEIDYAALEANQESYDAFFKYENIGTVNGAMSRTVELRRPFAQLNIGTADTEDAKKAEFEIQQTAVTVKQVFTKLDLATGTATDEQDVTFKLANKAEGTIAANGKNYDHIAMNYLLVNGKKLINVDLTINNGTSSLTRSYTSVPVERNYRTNIVGNIITAPAEFNVVILPGFEPEILPNENDVLDSFIAAAQQGGEITLTQDITLPAPLTITKKLSIDLNGHTISAAIAKTDGHVLVNDGVLSIKGGAIASTADNGGSAIKNNGTLIVEGTEITGAPKAGSSWPSYAINNYGAMTLKNVKVTSNHGAIAVYGDTTIENCEVVMNGIGGSSHVFYVGGEGTDLVINGGSYTHNGNTDGSLGYLMTGTTTTVNGGTFNAYNGGYGFATYTGALTINGGTFNSLPIDWGGPISIKGGVFASKPKDQYIAEGYKAMEKDGKYVVVPADVDAVASSSSELSAALTAGNANVMLTSDVTYSSAISNDANINLNGNTFEATTTLELKNNSDLTMVGGNYEVNSTYGHVDVRPSTTEGSVVVFEDVDFSYNKLGPTYGPSTNRLGSVVEVCATVTDANTKILFKNCTFDNAQVLFEGMSGKTGTFEAEFDGCTFNALTSSAPIYVQNYVKGTIEVKNCIFNLECTSSVASAIYVNSSSSTSVVLTATNNTINAVAATPYTFDASKGETEVHNVKVNGTVSSALFIRSYANTTVNETGTTKTGIAQ